MKNKMFTHYNIYRKYYRNIYNFNPLIYPQTKYSLSDCKIYYFRKYKYKNFLFKNSKQNTLKKKILQGKVLYFLILQIQN